MRVEATKVLNELLIYGLPATQELNINKSSIQSNVLSTLEYLITLETIGLTEPTNYNVNQNLKMIRELSLDCLFKCLENNGDNLIVGWSTIFKIIKAVCENKRTNEVKKCFESVNLICNDFLDELKVEELSECIKILTLFAKFNI